MNKIERVKREASYSGLKRKEETLNYYQQKMAEALHTGKPVYIGKIFGKDVWVTTNGVQKDNALGSRNG